MFASTRNFSQTLAGAAGTLLFAGLCIAGATAPAQADTVYGVSATGHRVAHVAYADLNLASESGRALLENRLRMASKQVCRGTAFDHRANAEERRCFKETLHSTRNATVAAIQADKVG
ncbi:UrcA family protein [Sandarakinorhabdus sp.]|uniref:UrcA family protein n=1 Tax=Sandarakinorhabdus sp. TaxID=1916663 RepID=UPI00334123E0